MNDEFTAATVILDAKEVGAKPSEGNLAGNLPSRIYAGFWIRLVASIIDDLIVTAASSALAFLGLYIIYLVMHPGPSFGNSFTGGFIQTVNLAAMTFFSIPYYVGFHWKFGATPGKMFLKIQVIREHDGGALTLGRSTGRFIATFVSALPFGAGFIMAAFSAKKQALHDRWAGTVSVMTR